MNNIIELTKQLVGTCAEWKHVYRGHNIIGYFKRNYVITFRQENIIRFVRVIEYIADDK